MNDQFFKTVLYHELGETLGIKKATSVSGGCINYTIKLETEKGDFFLKWNEFNTEDLFEKEVHGIETIKQTGTISVPEIIGTGKIEKKNYLLQKFIHQSAPSSSFWESFGESMAKLHNNQNKNYGLEVNNHIGRLKQINSWKTNWIDFFIENRLEIQLNLALDKRLIDQKFAEQFRQLYGQFPKILPEEPPSLLHGDLWSGNFMINEIGMACIFDPAVYYGNREAELSFTTLFGGFDKLFYDSYFTSFPVAPGFEKRIEIYNLYPLLVHVNLFGTSYLSGINGTIKRFT